MIEAQEARLTADYDTMMINQGCDAGSGKGEKNFWHSPSNILVLCQKTNDKPDSHAQWQTDSHPIFDTLSAAILKLESQTRTLEPVYSGPYL